MLFAAALALFSASSLVAAVPASYDATVPLRGCGTNPSAQSIAEAEARFSANRVEGNVFAKAVTIPVYCEHSKVTRQALVVIDISRYRARHPQICRSCRWIHPQRSDHCLHQRLEQRLCHHRCHLHPRQYHQDSQRRLVRQLLPRNVRYSLPFMT